MRAGLRRHWIEALLVLALPTLVLFVVGRQAWTPANTPDSEFYLSLAAFGHQVTDRAVVPAYYWTRLGVIAPLRGLSWLVGPDAAYAIWRWFLLSVAIVPSYIFARRRWGLPAAIAAAGAIGFSTVLLTVTANPYPTSAIVPLLIAESAILLIAITGPRRSAPWLAAVAGAIGGWLIMCNPVAGVFAALVALPFALVIFRRGLKATGQFIGAAVASAAASFFILLGAGRALFPALDWWETTRFYLSALNFAAFHSSSLGWLRESPLLLVPIFLIFIAAAVGLRIRHERQVMWVLAGSIILPGCYAFFNQFVQQGSMLETPVYVAFLWGPSLAALAVLVGWFARGRGVGAWAVAIGVLAGGCAAGRFWVDPFRVRPDGLAILLVVVGLALLAVLGMPGAPRRVLALVAAVGVVAGAQVLQNGTPTAGEFVAMRIPYSSAFQSTGAAAQYEAALDAERWVLSAASPGSRLLVWAPGPEFGGIAAMSLNGPNALSMSRDLLPLQMAWLKANAPVEVLVIGRRLVGARVLVRQLSVAGALTSIVRCTQRLVPGSGGVVAGMCIVRVAAVR